MITGAAQMDGAILVVQRARRPDAADARARAAGAPGGLHHLVVFLNKCDVVDDPELLDLVEMEVRELLNKYEFPGDETPVIRGAALQALNGDREVGGESIGELLDALDTFIPEPVRDIDKPFLMAVEDVFSIKGRGTVATGRIERGDDQGRRGGRDRRLQADTRRRSSPASRCSASCSTRGRRATTWLPAPRHREGGRSSAGRCSPSPGSITPHTKFLARCTC